MPHGRGSSTFLELAESLRRHSYVAIKSYEFVSHVCCFSVSLNSVAQWLLEPVARFTDHHFFTFRVSYEKQSLGHLVIQTPMVNFSSSC